MSLLDELDKETLRAFESLAATRSYPKGSIIIHQGDESDAFYLMLSGRAEALILHEDGRQIVLCTLNPGDYFGELSCLDGDARSATILTKSPSKCLVISQDRFHAICRDHPTLIWLLLRDLVRRVRRATRKIQELAFTDVYGRVARFLSENRAEDVIEHKLTHQDIANAVGASREMVSRVMKGLAGQGYIQQSKGRIRMVKEIPFENGLQ